MGRASSGLLAGTLLGSRYELLRQIGRGGQGEVWIARDRMRERRVVVKIRSIADASDHGAVASEARILLGLPPHQWIPIVRDDFFENERYCLVMDWIEGRSLGQILVEEGTPGIQYERVAPWIVQIADALDHLHRNSPPVFHQDVKPQNIVVAGDGRAVLVDFALAGSDTTSGERRGTPAYFAPELLDGRGPSVASDVYALAATAYAALTGTPPDPGVPPNLSTVPQERAVLVRDALWRALATDPERRPSAAGELANAFRHLIRSEPDLVGRSVELGSLTSELARALDGTTSTILLTGEGGIGKTTLLRVFAREAAAAGARVVWGRCWEGTSSPAYLPWAQLAGALVRDASGAVRTELGPYASYLSSIVPELAQGTERPSDDATLLYDGIVRLLVAAADEHPIVLLIDDLHLTDRSSARLLAHVAEHVHDAPIVLVVACREREARVDEFLGSVLDDLSARGRHINLEGLDAGEVRRFVTDGFGLSISDADVTRIRDATRGNPFFVNELVRLQLAERSIEKGDAPVPENLREAVRRRLTFLPADTRATLRVASVAGRSFDLDTIAHASAKTPRELATVIDHARRHGVIDEADRVGSYAFVHDVFHESIYDDIDPAERADLHRVVGQAIEADGPTSDELDHLTKLAFHFARAASAGEGRRATQYLFLAAKQAFRQMAYDEAISMFGRGLSLFEVGAAPEDPASFCAFVIELGVAELIAGRPSAEETLAEGAELARALGSGALLARVATCRPVPFGRVDASRRALIEDALALLGGKPTTQRVELLSQLGLMLSYSSERDRGIALCEEALRIAEALQGDLLVHGTRTNLMFTRSGPDHLEDRLQAFSGLPSTVVAARGVYPFTFERQIEIAALIEAGDIVGIDCAMAEAETLTTLHADPYAHWALAVFKGMKAILHGDFDAADVLIADALHLGELARSETALINYAAQLAIMRREQGRLAEIEPLLEAFVEQFPDLIAWRVAVAVLLIELGRIDDAREHFERVASAGFDSIPRDATWLTALSLLCEACAGLEDAERAPEVLVLLEPYSERVPTPSGAVALPPVAFGLGLLARTLGDTEAAIGHFDHAMVIARRMGSRPWEPRISLEWARAIERNDPEQAHQLVRRAARVAAELGMATLTARAAKMEAAFSSSSGYVSSA